QVVSTTELLEYFRTFANIVTAFMAYLGFRLAQDRWGFDKDKHEEERREKRRIQVKELLHLNLSAPKLGMRLAGFARSVEELNAYISLMYEESLKLSWPPEITKAYAEGAELGAV